MQHRRAGEKPKAYAPDGSHLDVAEEYWQAVAAKETAELCSWTFFENVSANRFQFRFLNQDVQLDLDQRCLLRLTDGRWQTSDDPLLALVTVVYLKNVEKVFPLGSDIVGTKDLKEGLFFEGPHELRTGPLLKRFGNDVDSFSRYAALLDGQPMEMADAAFRLLPFPRVPLYYLLWRGDREFKSRLQVLFDRSIETFLPADAIWALVNRVSMAFAEI